MLNSSVPPHAVSQDDIVKDVTVATFKADVVSASEKALVLAVFWTSRDKSVMQFVMTLEKLVRGANGAIRLAKIDVDRNPAVAQQMGVQSVPSVFAFHQSRLLDAFAGAMPEAQVKAWIDQYLKALGVSAVSTQGFEDVFSQADELLANGNASSARALFADVLAAEPENARAYAGFVRCILEEDGPLKACDVLAAAPIAIVKDKAFDSVRAAIELAELAEKSKGDTGALEGAVAQNPGDHKSRFDLALAYHAMGRDEDAVENLLEIVRRDRKWNDDGARKQLVKFFDAFGATNPMTVSARRRLSSILFS